MKDIALHINYLLLRHNWLTVMGLGAFICEYKAAFFDSDSNTWFPPCRRVRFIAGKFPEDNILLKSLLKKYDVTVRQGRELIDDFATNTLTEIQNSGFCEYSNFGRFHKTESGNIVFKSVESPEQTNSQLGYFPVDLKISEIGNLDQTQVEENRVDLAQKFNLEKNYYLPINKRFFRSVACIMLFVVLALSFVMPTEIAPQLDSIAIQQLPSSETLIKKTETQQTVAVVSEVKKTEPQIAEEKINTNANPEACKYHLIVGTFSNEAEARKYMSMQKDGDYQLILLPSKTLYRVACASSDRFDDLQQELNSSRLRTAYKDAWIWSSKRK